MKKDYIICSPEELPDRKTKWYVFLAGPIQGAPQWQFEVPNIPGVLYLSPRREDYTGFDYAEQFKWETIGLLISDVVLFWIPPEIESVAGRSYAQTTRTEFGEYLARGKKIIIGTYPEFPGRRYFESKLEVFDPENKIYNTLEETIQALRNYIRNAKPGIFFTSDTHFGSERSLELSKRPFKDVGEMDWTMIMKWNNKVYPGSTVYHLGDFGELPALRFLNGNLRFVEGNYERDGKSPRPGKMEELIRFEDYLLCHEPTKGYDEMKKDPSRKFLLFGHIHGRQKIKKFGLDVGVDCNNFEPISLEDVQFFRNAIEKGYYDQDVWIN